MRIILAMARNAFARCTRKTLIGMTGCACGAGMRARQWKFGRAVVEFRPFPARFAMTARAIGAEISLVHIVFAVTRHALHRCIAKFMARDMAGRAGQSDVLSF